MVCSFTLFLLKELGKSAGKALGTILKSRTNNKTSSLRAFTPSPNRCQDGCLINLVANVAKELSTSNRSFDLLNQDPVEEVIR